MSKDFVSKIQATPTLEGEDAENFWKKIQEESDKKVPLTPTPKLEGLRQQLIKEGKANSRPSIQIKPFFRWYDLWVGFYWDKTNRDLYFCPLPTLGIKISFRRVRKDKV
jgi:hypothetical protein